MLTSIEMYIIDLTEIELIVESYRRLAHEWIHESFDLLLFERIKNTIELRFEGLMKDEDPIEVKIWWR